MFEHRERTRSTFNGFEATRLIRLFLCASACVAVLGTACEPTGRLRAPAQVVAGQAEYERVWLLHRDGVSVSQAGSDAMGEWINLPGWIQVAEPEVCPPALARGPGGEAAVTSNILPVIWRIDPISFAVTRHDLAVDGPDTREVGFSGLTYSPAHAAYFGVSGLDGSLWRIDAALSRATVVNLTATMPRACGVIVVPGAGTRHGLEALCVRTEEVDWQVDLAAPDPTQGTAYPAPCSTASRRGSPGHEATRAEP